MIAVDDRARRQKGDKPAPQSEPDTTLRHTVPDPDYVSDREQSDSQRRKRMDQRLRGKPVTPPRDPK